MRAREKEKKKKEKAKYLLFSCNVQELGRVRVLFVLCNFFFKTLRHFAFAEHQQRFHPYGWW